MSPETPFRPHHTGAEVVVRIGPTAEISVTVDDGLPIIEIAWGSIALLLMPNTAAADVPVLPCDVDRARDLHQAAAMYLAALESLVAAQQPGPATRGATGENVAGVWRRPSDALPHRRTRRVNGWPLNYPPATATDTNARTADTQPTTRAQPPDEGSSG